MSARRMLCARCIKFEDENILWYGVQYGARCIPGRNERAYFHRIRYRIIGVICCSMYNMVRSYDLIGRAMWIVCVRA